jgi:uncharacterized protein YoxC
MVVGSLFATSKQHVLNTSNPLLARSPYSSQIVLTHNTPQPTVEKSHFILNQRSAQVSIDHQGEGRVSPPTTNNDEMGRRKEQRSSNHTPEICVHEPDEYFD